MWRPTESDAPPQTIDGDGPGFRWSVRRGIDAGDGWTRRATIRLLPGEFPRDAFADHQRGLDDALDALKSPVALRAAD